FSGTEGAVELRPSLAWEATYHLVNTTELFERFLGEMKKQPCIALDLDTTSLEPRRAQIVGMAFCWKEAEAWYLALRGPSGEKLLDEQTTLQAMKPILESERPTKVNQNIKYDIQVFKQHGIEVGGIAGDPMVADYLLNAGERSHSMDALAEK